METATGWRPSGRRTIKDLPRVIPAGPKPQERDRLKHVGRARRGVNRQGREKRRRRNEAGVETRDEEPTPPGARS